MVCKERLCRHSRGRAQVECSPASRSRRCSLAEIRARDGAGRGLWTAPILRPMLLRLLAMSSEATPPTRAYCESCHMAPAAVAARSSAIADDSFLALIPATRDCAPSSSPAVPISGRRTGGQTGRANRCPTRKSPMSSRGSSHGEPRLRGNLTHPPTGVNARSQALGANHAKRN